MYYLWKIDLLIANKIPDVINNKNPNKSKPIETKANGIGRSAVWLKTEIV